MNATLPTAAARLCAECGLCCNGAMFHMVILQPGENPRALAALGLKIKRKHSLAYMPQPCRAHSGGCCTVYEQRPQRCRIFECRTLTRLTKDEITEHAAMEKIHEARSKLARVENLLADAGETRAEHPLSKRCENIIADTDPHPPAFREALAAALSDFDSLLEADFRITPIKPTVI
jgi:hypothetical protein